MEHSQIIGKALLKGGQYFKKILKKEGGVNLKKFGLRLNEQNGPAFQLILDDQPVFTKVRPLNQNLSQIRTMTKMINKSKILRGIFGGYQSYESY